MPESTTLPKSAPKPASDPANASHLKSKPGLGRLINALKYSAKGFKAAWQHEAAFRQELALVIVALPLGLYLGKTGMERALLVGSLLTILLTELLNSAIEAIVDKTSPEFHDLAGRAKDLGSAAVFVSLTLAAAVWGFVLLG
ncbi:diacylglycerol kinase [Betaproteobacteria bacterium]|nr:diacylglycerol kinase [Betaproteobacteria bacterium]GHU41651.1 diacylglycerol kinase [Betaproteobacteria bacterium]